MNKVAKYTLPKVERDVVDRRIMELADNICESRLELLAFLLTEVDKQSISRYEAFRAFVKHTFMRPSAALHYIIEMGYRQKDAKNWSDEAEGYKL